MAWSGLLGNQMVSEIDAQTSGIPLKSGQAHGSTTLCITKASAFTKYDLLATADTNGLASNQLIRKDFWQANSSPTALICSQNWTTKNLDVDTYSDGTAIPQVTNPTTWAALTTGAWCYYNNDPANGLIYGKLYNWYAVAGIWNEASKTDVSQRKKLAPTGYHVPTDTEWTTLITCLGGESVAGNKMKETGTTHWTPSNVGATNSSGFTALPGGFRGYAGPFYNISSFGTWWSSTQFDIGAAWYRYITYANGIISRYSTNKYYGVSVRCIKDTAFIIYRSPGDSIGDSHNEACNLYSTFPPTWPLYCVHSINNFTNGDVLYTDPGMTIRFNGANLYYGLADVPNSPSGWTGFLWQISTTGVATLSGECYF